jgi:hypothetical protein
MAVDFTALIQQFMPLITMVLVLMIVIALLKELKP